MKIAKAKGLILSISTLSVVILIFAFFTFESLHSFVFLKLGHPDP